LRKVLLLIKSNWPFRNLKEKILISISKNLAEHGKDFTEFVPAGRESLLDFNLKVIKHILKRLIGGARRISKIKLW